jgi:hypothetical protein
LESVLKKRYKGWDKWVKKEKLPTSLVKEIRSRPSKEISRRESVKDRNGYEAEQIGPDIPQVKTSGSRLLLTEILAFFILHGSILNEKTNWEMENECIKSPRRMSM